jgi:hypothetical protein
MKFKNYIEERQGLGGGPAGIGGTDKCVCTECDYEEAHERGTPCNEKKCPKCNIPLIGSHQA